MATGSFVWTTYNTVAYFVSTVSYYICVLYFICIFLFVFLHLQSSFITVKTNPNIFLQCCTQDN